MTFLTKTWKLKGNLEGHPLKIKFKATSFFWAVYLSRKVFVTAFAPLLWGNYDLIHRSFLTS